MNIRSKISSIREYLTPINTESNFRKTGEISPDEFVKAGDYLVQKFPTWAWGLGPKNTHKKFLPADKQFLVTRHVPSYRRYASFVPEAAELDDEQSNDPDLEMIPRFTPGGAPEPSMETDNDLDELIEEDVEDGLGNDGDEFTNIESAELLLRKYDLYISYSTSYRVPKLYLVGFNASGIPLLPPQMYEDISGDHKDKTATIENLPMLHNTTSVSIHPCKHSAVMKVFMEHAKKKHFSSVSEQLNELDLDLADDPDSGIRVDQYLVIFLKFIASVTPGIEYDFTMDAL